MSIAAHVGHLAAWMLGLAAVAASSLCLVRALRVDGLAARLLAAAVLACAQMVLAIEALSLVGAIRLPALLGLHLALLAAVLASGLRPAPVPPRALRDALLRVTEGGAMRVLLCAVAVSGAALLALVLRVPPSNHDGLTYHMTRVAVYLQQGSLQAPAASDLRTTILPANAELLILWQAVLLRHDITAGLVQWASWLGAMLAAFGIGREAGLRARRAAFGALAFGCLPAAVLQATTVQNDLACAFFAAAALYFAGRTVGGGWADALLAGAAFGLAIGTKPTAALALPGVALFVLARWRARREPWAWGALGRLAAAGLLGTSLLGAYIYLQNVRRFGSPSGPAAFRDLMRPSRTAPGDWWANGGRLALRLLDPAGVLPPDSSAASLVAGGYDRLTDLWFRLLGIEPLLPSDFMRLGWWRQDRLLAHEDLAVFGPVYGALLALAVAHVLVRPRVDPRVRALGAGVFLYLAAVAVTLRYQPFHGRLLLTAAAMGAPLLGAAFREAPGRRTTARNGVLVAACLAALSTCVLYNERKPWLGPGSVWRGSDAVARMGLGRPGFEIALRLLDVLPDGRLAAIQLRADSAAYPLFGRHFARRVTFVNTARLPAVSAASLPEAEYLLVAGEFQSVYREGPPVAAEWPWVERRDLTGLRSELSAEGSGWSLLLAGAVYREPYLLFARKGLRLDAGALPAVLSPEPHAGTRVPSSYRVPVLFDPARPELVLSGTPLGGTAPVRIEARLPSGEPLARFEASSAGRFAMRIPLGRAFASSRALYTPLTIATMPVEGAPPDARSAAWGDPGYELRAPERP
jgi:hypothetical protein